jgi:hypothetical protein
MMKHLLDGTTLDGDFPNDYMELVKQLMRALRFPVPRDMQAVTDGILTRVTDSVRRAYPREERVRPPVYARLIALVGGFAIHETSGRWHLHYNEAFQLLEPWVEIPSGHFLPIFYLVYRGFYENKHCDPDSIDSIDIVLSVRDMMLFHQEPTPDE